MILLSEILVKPLVILVTLLSCNQVLAISYRVERISLLSPQQKYQIMVELRKVVLDCPIIINRNE